MSNRLLPVGSSPLEVAAAAACAELAAMPVPLRELWNPATCPVNLLPYLAWAFSVDHWDEGWTEETKRSVVSSAFFVHRHKGTIGAIRRVVEPLGYLIKLREWWETNAEPGTFSLDIGVLENGITEEMYLEMERMIADAKPVSRHLTGLALNLEASGSIEVAGGHYDAEITTVYPDYVEFARQMLEGHYQFLQRNTGTTLDSTQQHFVLNEEHVLADSRHERELSRMAGLPNDATTEGQALQILGYAHAYLATQQQKYLDQAIACFDAYVTHFYDATPIPESPQRWVANWIVNAKEPVPANWPVDSKDPTHSGFKGVPMTFTKGKTQIPQGAPYWGQYLDIATFAFDGTLAWDAINAQVRAVDASGNVDWSSDGKRYDVAWIINWQGYQINADGDILAKGLPLAQFGTVQLKDTTLSGSHKLNFANRQPVEHGGVMIERNQIQHNRPLHVPVPHNAMGNAADAELWFADACHLLHKITGEQRYFNAWKSVEFTAMEYTDIDAQDKFFRQSLHANTPFTDGISYDWSYPADAPVSYARNAEGMISLRKEVASQQSLEQQAVWFRINNQSKVRTTFGGVDDQNQPISCRLQLAIAPEKDAEQATNWGIGLPQSTQAQVKTYDIALTSLAALTREDGSNYLLADLRAVTDYGGCVIGSRFEEQVYDQRSATVINASYPNDDAGMVIGAWLTAEERFPVNQLVYRADADFNLRLEDDDKWRWYWMLPATDGQWRLATFDPASAVLSGYQPDHQDTDEKPARPTFSTVDQVTILQDGNVANANFSYYVLNDIPPTFSADDGYTIKYRVTLQAENPYTALLGDCTLLGHRQDSLFCTPGVIPFSNIYQADSQQFDGWHGMPYPGYQYPFIFVHADADHDGVMLDNMTEFLWQSQQWYQQQFGVLGPGASAYIWNRWDNLSYGKADSWTMYHWGDGAAWSGYQPRAFFGAARAWHELKLAGKTPPAKLVSYVENWLHWLIGFTQDSGGITPTDFPMTGIPQPDKHDFTGHMCGLWLAGAVMANMAGSEVIGTEHFIEQCVTELQKNYLTSGDVMDGAWSPAPRPGTDNGMFFGFWSGEILRGLSLYVMYKSGLNYPADKQKRATT